MIKELIDKKKYSQQINEAILLQNESSYYITRDFDNPFDANFRQRVLEIYSKDTYKQKRFFDAFAGKSLPSIEVCETVFAELFRVYDSQNQYSQYNFKDSDKKPDAMVFLDKFTNFWKTDFWEALKFQFNSFLVTDLPVKQTTELPEPYVFVLDISRVVYIEFLKDKSIKEIIFTEKNEDTGDFYYYYYTEDFYSKYIIKDEIETEIFNNPHKLGRCPVERLWPEKLNKTHVLCKGVLVPNLDDLFWYNIKVIESRKSDLLYLNPTLQRPKLSCGYDSTSKGNHTSAQSGRCVGGWLYSQDSTPVMDNTGNRVLCPVCGSAKHSGGGAGNSIDIDLNSSAITSGQIDPTRPMVSYIVPDIQGTIKQHEWIIEMKEHLIKSVSGAEQTQSTDAINEKQVKSSYESKEGVLKRIALNISMVREKIEYNLLKLRYFNSFTSNTFFLGSEFYLRSYENLQALRKNSTDPIQKKQIDEQIIEAKYRNSPVKLERERLLYKLLPFSTLSDDEFINLIGTAITDQKTIGLRLQFSDCVMMFENQFGSIIEFYNTMKKELSEYDKINTLKQTLLIYVQNQVSRSPADQ